jgi:hypothetical protein
MNENIRNVINIYIDGIESEKFHRYKSWDNCHEAFNSNPKAENLDLHLAFYLASWGMYRGSSGLLQLNHKVHEGAVKIIMYEEHQKLRCYDAKEVSKENIDAIIKLKNDLANYYGRKEYLKGIEKKKVSATDTLLSKIMLGTLGCVPAYDRYFIDGLKAVEMKYCAFNKESLDELFRFIGDNKEDIEAAQNDIKLKTGNHYPLMKIVDMYFWQIGFNKEAKQIKL